MLTSSKPHNKNCPKHLQKHSVSSKTPQWVFSFFSCLFPKTEWIILWEQRVRPQRSTTRKQTKHKHAHTHTQKEQRYRSIGWLVWDGWVGRRDSARQWCVCGRAVPLQTRLPLLDHIRLGEQLGPRAGQSARQKNHVGRSQGARALVLIHYQCKSNMDVAFIKNTEHPSMTVLVLNTQRTSYHLKMANDCCFRMWKWMSFVYCLVLALGKGEIKFCCFAQSNQSKADIHLSLWAVRKYTTNKEGTQNQSVIYPLHCTDQHLYCLFIPIVLTKRRSLVSKQFYEKSDKDSLPERIFVLVWYW